MKVRDLKRIDDVLEQLKILWDKNPDIRFFQLIRILEHRFDLDDSFYFEDEDLLVRLKELNHD